MPKLTPVIATSIRTGETFHYRSIAQAVREGGFEKTCIVDCVRGLQGHHAGFRFVAPSYARESRTEPPRVVQAGQLEREGLSTPEIAAVMGIAYATAKKLTKQARVMERLNA